VHDNQQVHLFVSQDGQAQLEVALDQQTTCSILERMSEHGQRYHTCWSARWSS